MKLCIKILLGFIIVSLFSCTTTNSINCEPCLGKTTDQLLKDLGEPDNVEYSPDRTREVWSYDKYSESSTLRKSLHSALAGYANSGPDYTVTDNGFGTTEIHEKHKVPYSNPNKTYLGSYWFICDNKIVTSIMFYYPNGRTEQLLPKEKSDLDKLMEK